MQPRFARPADGPPATVLPEEKNDMIDLVLRLEAEHERRIAVLLQDGRGNDGRFEAMDSSLGDRAPEGAARFLGPLPVIAERIDEALHLLRGPVLPDECPFLGGERGPSGETLGGARAASG